VVSPASGMGPAERCERQWLAQVDRQTVRRYVAAAEKLGVRRDGGDGQLDDVFVGMVVEAVRPHRQDGHGGAWQLLVDHHDEITGWVTDDNDPPSPPPTLTRHHHLGDHHDADADTHEVVPSHWRPRGPIKLAGDRWAPASTEGHRRDSSE
jgi:hypothetical protein